MLFHRAGASMTRCRGGDSQARRSTCAKNRLPFRGTHHCRGGACPSRRRTYSLYKPPSKWQTLPICHCEEANGRRGALSAKREEVPLGCNLGKAVTISPIVFLGSGSVLRDCHVALLLAMTRQGSAVVHQRSPAVELLPTGRSLSVATVKFGSACGRRWLVRAATASPRLPRRFAPRNDNLGECRGAPAPLHGLIPLYKALTARKGHAAFVRRQSRQRLRSDRRYSQIWQRVRLAMACTGCNCLSEIAPQGHFLALRAQGATSLRSSQ